MNKLFTKIATLSVGLAMAVGVGVALATSNVKAMPAKASSDYTATLAQSSSTPNYTDDKSNTWSMSYVSDGAVSVDASTWLKTGTNSVKATSISLETEAYSDYVIDKITVHVKAKASTKSYGYIYIGGEEVAKSSELTNSDTPVVFDNSTDKKTGSIKVSVARDNSDKGALYLGTVVVEYSNSGSETYTVSFNANGGSGEMGDVADIRGSYELPDCGFTAPANKAFTGWKANNAGDLIAAGGSYTVLADVTFYAQWANAYSITYTAGENGSGSYVHQNQPEGDYALLAFDNLTGVTANEGYRFANYTISEVSKEPGDIVSLSGNLSVTVNFEVIPMETTYNFVTNFATYAKEWSGYATHEGLNGVTDIGGDFAATIDLYYVSKQSGTITDRPVFATKTESGKWTKVLQFTLNEANYKLDEISVSFAQWSAKTPDVALFKGNSVGGTPLDTATIGTKNTLEASSFNGTVFTVGYCDKSTSNVQAGLTSITVSLVPIASFGTLDHIKVTSLPNTVYHVGENYSATGLVVTAYDNADESIANFEDVTASATYSLADGTELTDSHVPSVTNTVTYERDEVSKQTSFAISVYALAQYRLVESEPADWSGSYLIVGADSESNLLAMNGGLTNPDDEKNYKAVTANDGVIEAGQELEWTIAKMTGGYSLQGKLGKYIGSPTSDSNGMLVSDSPLLNTLSIDGSDVTIQGTNGKAIKYHTTADRFRYYADSSVKLYKLIESDAGLVWAQSFLDDLTCDASGESKPSVSQWNTLAGTYDDLDPTVKEQFRIGVASESGTVIQQALAKYDYVLAKYGTDDYSNFMARTITPLLGIKTPTVAENNNTSLMIIVTVVAITSVSAIGILLVIKRRKSI